MDKVLSKVRNLDAYPKISEDFYSRTLSGGLITLLSSIDMLLLFFSELDDECCNSCDEVREAYRKKCWGMTNPELIDQCKREGYVQKIKDEEGEEGCDIYGSLEVNKVAGNFHFTPGKSFHQSNILQDLLVFQEESYNGVPTISTNIRGHIIFNQIRAFQESRNRSSVTSGGVFFFYDLSPIKVTFKEEHASFLHFMTNIYAIIGGIFMVAGIVVLSFTMVKGL